MTKPGTELLLKEIKHLRHEIEAVFMVVESRLIGFEEPTKAEKRAIAEFESQKKTGRLKLVPLSRMA